MNITNPPGDYDGTITGAKVESFGEDLIMVFDIELETEDGGCTEARHMATGKWSKIGREVAEHLELSWPEGLKQVPTTVGRKVRVRVKHKDEKYENAYILTGKGGGGEPATPQQIDAAIAKLAAAAIGDEDDIPF